MARHGMAWQGLDLVGDGVELEGEPEMPARPERAEACSGQKAREHLDQHSKYGGREVGVPARPGVLASRRYTQ